MKLITLSIAAACATTLVSCKNTQGDNPYGAPAASTTSPSIPQNNPYAVPQSNGETDAYGATPQQAPYQPLPGVGNTLPSPTPSTPQVYQPNISQHQDPMTAGSTLPHTVQKGDSLWKLARENNTTVEAIQTANGITGTNIMIGQTIQIPTN